MDKKTLLDMKLLLEYNKNDNILDKYRFGIGFGDGRLVLDNEVMDILDNVTERIYIEPFSKHIRKDKENKRLNNIIDRSVRYLKIHGYYDNEIGRIVEELNDDECTELLQILEDNVKEEFEELKDSDSKENEK